MDYGKVAFVGGGNMTRALAGGMVAAGYEPHHILVSEPLAEHRDSLGEEVERRKNALASLRGE